MRLTFIDKENKYALDNFEVTSKFTDEFINKLDLAADEFFDNYPKNIFVKGIEYPARACDYQDMKIAYIKGIKSSIKRHKEVIAGLKQDLELSPYAKANIMNYIGGRMWENRQEETKVKTRGY